jgi:hypothetical protein
MARWSSTTTAAVMSRSCSERDSDTAQLASAPTGASERRLHDRSAMMRSAALAILLAIGCDTDGTSTCDVDFSSAPFTPGTVACGTVADCPAGQCSACEDPAQPVPGRGLYCGTASAGLTCFGTIGCDGPEDCAPGEFCWEFESRTCTTTEWPQPGFRVCKGGACERCE